MTTIFSRLQNVFALFFIVVGLLFAVSCSQDKVLNSEFASISNSRSDDQDFNNEDEVELEPCEYCIEFVGDTGVWFELGFQFMDSNLNFEYSFDKKEWFAWELQSANGGKNYKLKSVTSEQDRNDYKARLYVRGNGNKKITNGETTTYGETSHIMIEKASYGGIDGTKSLYGGISCNGNIETLLDWKTVSRGEHPEMGDRAFAYLFENMYALKSAPELLSTTLTEGCYMGMFIHCAYLKTPPSILPAKKVSRNAYYAMFDGCSALKKMPYITANEAEESAFSNMLQNCSNVRISKVQTSEYSHPFIVEVAMPNIKGIVEEEEMIEYEAVSLKANTLYFSMSAFGDQNINPADYQPEIVIESEEEPATDDPTPTPPTPATDDPTPNPPTPATDDPTPATDNKPSQTKTATGSGKALTAKPGSKSPKELAKSGVKKPFTGGTRQSGTGVIRL